MRIKEIKKIIAVILIIFIIGIGLISCGDSDNGSGGGNDNAPPKGLDENPASDFEYSYNAELGGIEITTYTGTPIKVRIPEKIEGEPVVSIGSYAFVSSGIMEVYIPNSVKNIGENAFDNCTSLTSVVIPKGVTSIENFTFDNCTSLMSVSIPDSVTRIGFAAFRYSALTSVTIPDSVTSIDSGAFSQCPKLTSVIISNNVTKIGSSAFSFCTGLTKVTIPDSVTGIEDSVFAGIPDIEVTYKGNTYNAETRFDEYEQTDVFELYDVIGPIINDYQD